MRKKITILLFSLLVAAMPFVDFSCRHGCGYTVGFPVAFVKIFLDPFIVEEVYPVGYIDFLFVLLGLFICRAIEKSRLKQEPRLNIGIRWLSVYLAMHFISHLYLSLISEYFFDIASLLVVRFFLYFIMPFTGLAEKLDIFYIEDTAVALRVNFAFSCLLYFILGVQASRLLRFIKSKQGRKAV